MSGDVSRTPGAERPGATPDREDVVAALDAVVMDREASETLAAAVMPVVDALRDVIAERETEVDGLAERVAALRAELDRAHAMAAQYADRAITNGKRADKAEAERDRLATQVAAVRAVHPRRDDPSGPVCGRCLDAYEEPVDWPCPTIRALDGPAGGERP